MKNWIQCTVGMGFIVSFVGTLVSSSLWAAQAVKPVLQPSVRINCPLNLAEPGTIRVPVPDIILESFGIYCASVASAVVPPTLREIRIENGRFLGCRYSMEATFTQSHRGLSQCVSSRSANPADHYDCVRADQQVITGLGCTANTKHYPVIAPQGFNTRYLATDPGTGLMAQGVVAAPNDITYLTGRGCGLLNANGTFRYQTRGQIDLILTPERAQQIANKPCRKINATTVECGGLAAAL